MVERGQLGLQFRRRQLEEGGSRAADICARVAESDLRHVVKESKQTVVVALRERIELVIVAAAAIQGQPEPDGRRRLDAIRTIFGQELVRDAPPSSLNMWLR